LVLAAPWDGQQFNYQLGEAFNLAAHRLAGVNVYFVDHEDTSTATVAAMKAAGLVPICYFRYSYRLHMHDCYVNIFAVKESAQLPTD
jgi:hypothetical protein